MDTGLARPQPQGWISTSIFPLAYRLLNHAHPAQQTLQERRGSRICGICDLYAHHRRHQPCTRGEGDWLASTVLSTVSVQLPLSWYDAAIRTCTGIDQTFFLCDPLRMPLLVTLFQGRFAHTKQILYAVGTWREKEQSTLTVNVRSNIRRSRS